MTDEELERMRAYAEAAREHPTWSVAYAQDVPKLLAVIERLTSALDQVMNDGSLEPIERRQIATHALAGVVYAEPVPHDRLWHRLRFAEMVLDKLNAEIDGVPWREAARLGESLDGEPVTDAEPFGKRLDDARLAYVTVQIDRSVWDCVRLTVTEPVAPPAGTGVQS